MKFEPKALKMEKLPGCPMCGSKRIPVTTRRTWLSIVLNYCTCQECGQVFENPRMTDEQTETYYRGWYRSVTDPGGVRTGTIEIEQRRRQMQIEILGPYLAGIKTNLEIGSSSGNLMAELAARGIECTGVEPDEGYRKMQLSKRFKVYERIDLVPKQGFDLITSSHSIEHLNHPVEYFRNLAENYSHQGTLFFIETPNHAVCNQYLLHHPFCFTAETLDKAMERAGLKLVAHVTHGLKMTPARKYLVGIYIQPGKVSAPAEAKRKKRNR